MVLYSKQECINDLVSLQLHQHLKVSLFISVILIDMECSSSFIVLIFISLMAHDVEHLFLMLICHLYIIFCIFTPSFAVFFVCVFFQAWDGGEVAGKLSMKFVIVYVGGRNRSATDKDNIAYYGSQLCVGDTGNTKINNTRILILKF